MSEKYLLKCDGCGAGVKCQYNAVVPCEAVQWMLDHYNWSVHSPTLPSQGLTKTIQGMDYTLYNPITDGVLIQGAGLGIFVSEKQLKELQALLGDFQPVTTSDDGKCPECKDTGQVQLFVTIQPCNLCNKAKT